MGFHTQPSAAMERRGSHQQNLKLNNITTHLQDLASVIYLNNDQCYMGVQQHDLPEPEESPGDNFSETLPEQDTLESMVQPHLSRNRWKRSLKFDPSSCCKFPGCDFPTPDSSQDATKESCFSPQEKDSSGFVSAACSSAASSGPILSSKKRIKWTQDLHEQFVQCVNHLGGAEKATPKAILKLMKPEGMNITHMKSHLQKYRSDKYISESSQGKPEKIDCVCDIPQLYMTTDIQIKKALQMQLELQKQLHEQLEIQQNLQMMIEEQGKQVKNMILEKQQIANKRQLDT